MTTWKKVLWPLSAATNSNERLERGEVHLRIFSSMIDVFLRCKQYSSDVFPLETGLPQGSSFGPFLSSLSITLLSAVINSFGVSHIQYPDDTKLIGYKAAQLVIIPG